MVVNYQDVHAKTENNQPDRGCSICCAFFKWSSQRLYVFPQSEIYADHFYHSYIKYSDKKAESQNFGSNKIIFPPEGKNSPYSSTFISDLDSAAESRIRPEKAQAYDKGIYHGS